MRIELSVVLEQAEQWASLWERQAVEHRRLAEGDGYNHDMAQIRKAQDCDTRASTVREFARAVAQSAGVAA